MARSIFIAIPAMTTMREAAKISNAER